ncbi:hypothetical protein WG66_016701 [Moniliophthora roreri]|nr:hypothetical protein WG66_016701 [Moniliophthora roreri]
MHRRDLLQLWHAVGWGSVQNLALLTLDSGSIPRRPTKDSALSLAPYLPCCAICYWRVTSQHQITHSRLQRVSGTQYLLLSAPQDVVFSKNNGIYCRSTHASFHLSITDDKQEH